MRNLKRALSLLLAVVMVIGMMVVGASAASYTDFSDKGEIVNKDAVSMLTTLGIIEGKPDGSYAPGEGVDRAQMAKMISVIMNQGTDNSALYENSPTGLTDIASNWAKGHINYCYTTGIIAGRGNGTFDPSAGVTAVEAAKMLLVAAGYDPKTEGLEGSDWAINTNALASRLGIFRSFTKDVTQALNRDDAALLIYNALDVEMIEKYENGYAIAYNDSRTILSAMYGVYKVEGVVLGNEYAVLNGTDYDESMMDGKTLLAAGYKIIASTTSNTMVEDPATKKDTTFNVETPVEYLGKTVTMYVRKDTILANSEVLGVTLNEKANTIVTSVANETDMKDLLKGTGISLKNNETEYYVNYGIVKNEDAANDILKLEDNRKSPLTPNSNGIELEIIDNDNDGVAEYVLWVQEDLTVITSLNEKKETIAFGSDTDKDITSYNKGRAIDLEDVTLYDGAEEGDIVLVRTYGGHYYVSQPEVVTGEMESYSSNKTKEQWIKVDGTEYKPSFINVTGEGYAEEFYTFDVTECAKDGGVQWDTKYDFYLDSNGYVAAFKPAEKTVNNYALVLESGYEPGAFASDATGKVTVLLADSTEATYTLNFTASAKNLGEQIADADGKEGVVYSKEQGIQELKGFLGTADSDNSSTRPWADSATGVFVGKDNDSTGGVNEKDYLDGQAKGYVITYSLTDDNVLTIKSVVGSYNSSSAELKGLHGASDTKTFTNKVVADGYDGGAASLKYQTAVAGKTSIAIDEDTVAFYYKDSKTYGVAVGYSKMANVAGNKDFMAQKVGTTNLADVVLFNDEGVVADKDYIYILGRNDHSNSGKYVEVYGVLEDGTAATLKITRDNYDDMDLDKVALEDSRYYHVFAYTTNSDDVSTLSNPDNNIVLNGYGLMLTNRTVAFDTKHTADDPLTNNNYMDSYALPSSAKVWNVTDIDEGDNAPAGSFSTRNVKHTILVLDSTKTKIETAFVWDLEIEDAPDPVNPEIQVIDDDAANDYANPIFYIAPDADGTQDKLGTAEMRRALTSKMEKNGCTDIVWDGNKVTFEDADGYPVTSTVDFTQSYALKVDSKDVEYVKADTATPVSGLNGSWYTTDGGKTFDEVADVASDIAKMPAHDLTIESGYTKVDLSTTLLSGNNTSSLNVALTLNGKAVTSGTAKNVYFVKGTGNELVATVTGTVNVAQSGTGTLKGDNSVAKVVKEGTVTSSPANDGTKPAVNGSDSAQIDFVASTSDTGNTVYADFELTFTWSVTQGTDLSAVTLTGTDFAA